MRLRNSLSSCLQTALPSPLHTKMVRRNSKESVQTEKKDWGEMTPEAIQALCVRFILVSFKTTKKADSIFSSPMPRVAFYIVIQYYGESIL